MARAPTSSEMFRQLAIQEIIASRRQLRRARASSRPTAVALDKRANRIPHAALTRARLDAASRPGFRAKTTRAFSPQPALMDRPPAESTSSSGAVASVAAIGPAREKKGADSPLKRPAKRQRREVVADAD
ncbi:unnamed protein product [Prorocentrum cordatum]|uniref:Ribosome biogenesis protein NOP53 n=1 Tax=Prorocentrum cordatum TaxID=2364126 RepID=A0ABN9PBH4_9DINO|nr:unnamed protein product [Polarella glacialis]